LDVSFIFFGDELAPQDFADRAEALAITEAGKKRAGGREDC
jgi:hypothetical protein